MLKLSGQMPLEKVNCAGRTFFFNLMDLSRDVLNHMLIIP
jgi:hypothetical protein